MLDNIFEKFFLPIALATFFLLAAAYNLFYFGTFGDSLFYFLYVPVGFVDLLKTGLVTVLFVLIFIALFKPIFIDPAFSGNFPGSTSLLVLSGLVFLSNLFYFVIFDEATSPYFSMIAEITFYGFSLAAFFGVVYFFIRDMSQQFLLTIFFLSLIPISALMGWASAKLDIYNFTTETKSKILLNNDNVVNAKILRSFDKGILIMTSKNSDINFISWDEIKEAKFKKVTSL